MVFDTKKNIEVNPSLETQLNKCSEKFLHGHHPYPSFNRDRIRLLSNLSISGSYTHLRFTVNYFVPLYKIQQLYKIVTMIGNLAPYTLTNHSNM